VDVPVQFFQSMIAIELAVAGALLWQMRFFEPRMRASVRANVFPTLAYVLASPSFWAQPCSGPCGRSQTKGRSGRHSRHCGVAVSLIPILLRVLPPLAKDAATNERDSHYAITVVGLVLYVAVVAGFPVLLDID
jgi:hypothetical protein